MLCLVAAACRFDSAPGGTGGDLGGSTAASESTSSTGPAPSSTSLTTTGDDPRLTTTGAGASSSASATTTDSVDTSSSSESGRATTTGGALELEVAEALLVSLDATKGDLSDEAWINRGSLGDFSTIGNPIPGVSNGVMAARISSDNGYVSADEAPATLVGVDPTRSVEVWAYNPSTTAEETMVAWGRRGGPAGSNFGFNYGDNSNFGAMTHWEIDLGWGAMVPEVGVWHHLVFTFDGGVARAYADGVLANERAFASGEIDTHADERILIGAQWEANGSYSRWGSLSLARVRVHAGTLSERQIAANYELERDEFQP